MVFFAQWLHIYLRTVLSKKRPAIYWSDYVSACMLAGPQS